MNRILDQTLSTPTAFNLQPYQLLLVNEKDAKEKLSKCMLGGNANRVNDSTITCVLLSDLQPSIRIPKILESEQNSGCRTPEYLVHLPLSASFFTGEGGHLSNALKSRALLNLSQVKPVPHPTSVEGWSNKNTGMVAMTYILSCESEGYSTSAMEGFDMERVKEALGIPDRYTIPMIISTGVCGDSSLEREKRTPRLSKEETVMWNCFGKVGEIDEMYRQE
jgi:nitroreductase